MKLPRAAAHFKINNALSTTKRRVSRSPDRRKIFRAGFGDRGCEVALWVRYVDASELGLCASRSIEEAIRSSEISILARLATITLAAAIN